LTRRAYFYWKCAALLGLLVAAIAYFTPLNGFAGFILFFTGIVAVISRKRHPAVTPSEAASAIM
jgi:hypothetical protein